MTVIVDTSVILALIVAHDEFHERAEALYAALDEDIATTPLVVAEMDYLITRRGGRTGADALWGALDSGAVQVRWWATAMSETLVIARRTPSLGLADSSLLALAPIVRTTRIATFDPKHFAAARSADGEPFVLLP